jgi:hypothetical protein
MKWAACAWIREPNHGAYQSSLFAQRDVDGIFRGDSIRKSTTGIMWYTWEINGNSIEHMLRSNDGQGQGEAPTKKSRTIHISSVPS